MSLTAIFQASMYGLCCLAAFILGRAEGTSSPTGFIPFVTIPIAVVGFLTSERWRRFRVGVLTANGLGLVAFFVAMVEFVVGDQLGKLLAGAHLVVYLGWIVLLQVKTERQYWAICALGLLQVAVASVLISTSDTWFGPFLILYAIGAMWTLAVFTLHQADQQFRQSRVLADTHEALLPTSATGTRAAEGSVVVLASEATRTISHDGSSRWVTPRFVVGVLTVASLSLLVSTIFFILVPRVWIGQRFVFADEDRGVAVARKTITGFAPQVRLGQLGEVLESVEPVLECRLFDSQTDRELDINDYSTQLGYAEPLFRGSVLGQYEQGRWSGEQGFSMTEPMIRADRRASVKQVVVLEPIGTDVLFCIGYARACDADGYQRGRQIVRQSSTSVVVRDQGSRASDQFTYTVYSEPIPVRPRMHAVMPVRDATWHEYNAHGYLESQTQLPKEGLEPLVELTKQIVADARQQLGRDLTLFETAQAIEHYLRDSGRYHYTLSQEIKDPKVDPVVDFLLNRHEGHCEYFNSALTLMLRAADIPARLVNGFKGGDLNASNGRFQVQQRHAHVWTEAFMNDPVEGFRWVIFDATPPDERAQSVSSVVDKRNSWQKVSSEFGNFWNKYVMNLSLGQQERSVYGPIREIAAQVWENLKRSFRGGPRMMTGLSRFFLNPREWFSPQGVLTWIVTFVTLLVVSLGFQRGRVLFNRWWASFGASQGPKRRLIEFYERFTQLLQKQGLVRQSHQTQQEFSHAVDRKLGSRFEAAGLGHLTRRMTDLYYRVRFGEEELSAGEAAELDELLARMESLFAPKQPRSA